MHDIRSLLAVFGPFTNGLMLLWVLAAAIPVIIHLWNRRRYQEMNWAAMEFLLAAMRKNSRRITIEQLILLALRVLILIALAVALADPILPRLSSFVPGVGMGGQTHWVLVIDGSYSMDYKQAEKNRFQTAQDVATQLVDESVQGDGFTLVLMCDPPQVIVREPGFAREDVMEEIANLKLRHGGGNLTATLAEVDKILATASQKHPRLAQSNVCFFTDLGRTTWDDVESAENRARIGVIAERATLAMFDLGSGTARENLAVAELGAPDSLATVGRPLSFRAEIKNFGSQQVATHQVEFYVDGSRLEDQIVDVPANGQTAVSLLHRFSAPGEHYVEVRLAGDSLGVDNHRWISVPVRESIPVLCIEGKRGSAYHAALALEPTKSDRPRIATTVMSETAILESDLNDYDCVFLCNVGRFGRDEAVVLGEYLEGGGGLVFFLGDQVQPDSYNTMLTGSETLQRVLPARLGPIAAEAQYRFDPLDYEHPIVAPFRGHQQSGLLTTPVWRYFQLTPHDELTAQVALAFEGGDPAIVEESILRGRSVLYATAASGASVDRLTNPPTPWTAIHTWPSFPPLIQETLALAVSGRTAGRNVRVGDELEGVILNSIDDRSLTMIRPDGREERLKLRIDGDDSRWDYADVWQSGIYETRPRPPERGSQKFAVNVDTRESSLERFDAELLPSQFSQEFEVNEVEVPDMPSSARSQLFQYVLCGLLVLLLCESLLAWHFGRAKV